MARDIFAASATLTQSLALHGLETNARDGQCPAVKLSFARNMSLQKGHRVVVAARRTSAPWPSSDQPACASLPGRRADGYRGFSLVSLARLFLQFHVQTSEVMCVVGRLRTRRNCGLLAQQALVCKIRDVKCGFTVLCSVVCDCLPAPAQH